MRWLLLVGLWAGCDFHVDGVGLSGVGAGGGAPPSADSPDLSNPHPITPAPDLAQAPDLAPLPASGIGSACDPHKNACAAGETCLTKIGNSDVPGGYCTISCETTPCPSGSQCAGAPGSRLCVEECPATGCRAGFICCTNNFTSPGVCLQAQYCGG